MSEALKGIQNFLQLVINNWTTILVIVGLGIAIFQKAKSYLALTKQQKIDIAMNGVSDIMLSLVIAAQEKFGTDMGAAKRSQVISEIYSKFPILTQVINKDELTKKLDEMINNAIDEMIKVLKAKSDSSAETTNVSGIEVSTENLNSATDVENMDIVETK